MDVTDHVTEVSVSAGRKVQLERYEPIEEYATVTVEVPDDLGGAELSAFMESVADLAWDECERGLMKRREQHIENE